MSAKDEAWAALDRWMTRWFTGVSSITMHEADTVRGLVAAIAAAAVAEARAPLVEALRDCHVLLQDAHYEYDLLGRNFCGPDVAKVIEAAAAALAKGETP